MKELLSGEAEEEKESDMLSYVLNKKLKGFEGQNEKNSDQKSKIDNNTSNPN